MSEQPPPRAKPKPPPPPSATRASESGARVTDAGTRTTDAGTRTTDAGARVSETGTMTDGQKAALALEALGLLNEQVEARIVHYKAELQTSPELDAVTAQVVTQLRAMQAALARPGARGRKTPDETEAEQIEALTMLLARVVQPESPFASSVLKPIGRRVAKLFFESELHEKTKADKDKTIHHAEQGVYYVLKRYGNRMRAELEGFEYESEDIRALTRDLLAKMQRDLQIGFLSRRSPELNRVMTTYTTVLTDFLQHHLPTRLEQMAKIAVRAAGTAQRPDSVSYKILAGAFPEFRLEWERVFMQQMVFYCGDELLARLSGEEALREETIKFFTDPHVFSETCQVLCESLYDFLCFEGFLDLPLDWRASKAAED